jgi:hypothetical protein
MISPSHPRRFIRRCQEGLDFRSRQVANQFLILPLHRDRQDAGDHAEAVRVAQRDHTKERPDSGQTDIA